eukprot:Skav217938  [mRNA]  locus=scaffold1737:126699:129917:- [translate_table: standard]
MNSQTARGACGWSVDELKALPIECISKLITAFDLVLPHGLPAHLMRARTIPLSKKPNSQRVEHTRPITILGVLYRLWSKITTKQVLSHWSYTFPASITGFLPGRSYELAQYSLQFELEMANLQPTAAQYGGLTLDLRKAFNNLPKLPCKLILLKLGVPVHWVVAWYSSLNQMVRFWQVDGQLFDTQAVTTGVPEGDNWSVCCMVGINYVLETQIRQFSCVPNLFADNWSYHCHDPDEHSPILDTINRFTSAMRLSVDWSKTWCWGTDRVHQQKFRELLNHLDSTETFCEVKNAKDLGHAMHYNKRLFRGPQRDRHVQALKRLKQIQRMEISIEAKAHLIVSSCYAKALHGAHLYATGQKFFTDLRSAVADAILGRHKNSQSFLANMIFTTSLIDPELFVIKKSVLTARSFLWETTPETRTAFLNAVAQNTQTAARITGPAGALQHYLSRLGWQINRQGELYIDSFLTLHICTSTVADLTHALEQSWMEVVSTSITNRKGYRNCPVVDRLSTIQVFARQPESAKHALALQMTCTPMTNLQKKHFVPDRDENCTFCQCPDSVRHQVLECESTASARLQHSAVVQQLEDRDPIHTLLPVVFRDPYFEMMRTLQYSMQEPQLDFQGHHPRIAFTDGSCLEPARAQSRWATYAIVCPVRDIHRSETLSPDEYNVFQHSVFYTVAVGHVRGQQTINRAELTAAVLVHEQRRGIEVVTDSDYVLKRHRMLQNTPDVHRLHKKANFDLLQRWHKLLWEDRISTPTTKVKAHALGDPTSSDPLVYRLGNDVADKVAKHAASHLVKPYIAQLTERSASLQQDMQLLDQQFKLRTDLSQLRAQLLKQEEVAAPWNPDEVAAHFSAHTVDNPETYLLADDGWEAIHASKYGTEFSELVIRWSQTLRWPKEPEPGRMPIGISLFELAINFLITSQRAILTQVDGTFLDVDRTVAWSRGQCDITRWAQTLHHCLKHVEYLTQSKLFPPTYGSHVSSLYRLGGGVYKHGYNRRPQMDRQTETIECVVRYLQQHRTGGKATFSVVPTIPVLEPIFQASVPLPGEDNPRERERRYHQRRRHIKECARNS